ncbi:FV3-083R, partial [Symbiodinium pilosum]
RRVSGSDSNFTFELPETLHMFASPTPSCPQTTGRNLYWIDEALGTLNTAQLPVGAYTGTRLAAWISSNYASATYMEAQNSIEVASDGNRRVLSDAELLNLFPNGPGYPPGAYATRPQSINHLLGGSYLDGVYLRSRELGNAAHILGPLGNDIICKVIIDKGVGHVMKDQTDDGHLVELRGPITLRTLNFRLTDVINDFPYKKKAEMPDEQKPDQAEEAAGAAAGPEPAERGELSHAAPEPVRPTAGLAGDLPAVSPPGPADAVVAVPPAEGAGAAEPKAAPKKRGRPPRSKNKPKPPPATVRADPGQAVNRYRRLQWLRSRSSSRSSRAALST